MSESNDQIRVAVVGASGYTGAELIRLLAGHPRARIVALTGDRKAGQEIGDVFPHLRHLVTPIGTTRLVALDDIEWSTVDVAFFGLPHGAAQPVAATAPRAMRAIDLSPDFRFSDPEVYAAWYGQPHQAPAAQKEAVYGLAEINRDAIRGARIIGCPGCYPTASLLPLIPLIESGVVVADDIIIDAKSGVSGAGRAAKEGSLHAEVSEGVHAYGVAGHRHAPEIEQGLSRAAGRPVLVNFTPHLMPMNRGILATIYARLAPGADAADARRTLAGRYEREPFVHVLDEGQIPMTRHVRGSNHCLIGVFADRLPNRVIVLSVIDNLVKGASGQAVQDMNIAFGFPETEGLAQPAFFP